MCTTYPPQKRGKFLLKELADAGIKYNVVNLRWGRTDKYKVLKSQFLLGKSPTVALEQVNRKSEVTYQICRTSWPKRDSCFNSSLTTTPTASGSRDQRKIKREPPSSKSLRIVLYCLKSTIFPMISSKRTTCSETIINQDEVCEERR